MNFIQNIQVKFKQGNIVEKLIYINIGIFFITLMSGVFGDWFKSNSNFIIQWFSLKSDWSTFIAQPWTIISYGFLHAGFIHILFNLITLFYIGNLFLEYFTQKQLLNFYVFGTIFGGLLFLISHNNIPLFKDSFVPLVGASAGISAIFIGIATYIPNYQIKIRFIGFVHLWKLATIWVVLDLIQLSGNNAGGHFAHLGGALFGFLYVSFASNTKIDLLKPIKGLFSRREKPLQTVYNSGRKTRDSKKATKSENQQQIDAILDKISKSGYDTLTKEEKAFLFQQGKK